MLIIDKDNTIHLTRGDTARFRITQATNLATGEPYVFLPEDKLEFTIKKSVSDADPLIHKSVSGGEIIHLLPEDTKPLSFGRYVYDVQLTVANGDVYTIIVPTVFEIAKEGT